MKSAFDISFRNSSGNLHIRLQGAFDAMCAWTLIKTISRHYPGTGRVFVATGPLDAVQPDGAALFKQHMTARIMPLSSLFFKGEKGFAMAPDGTRVVIGHARQERRRPQGPFIPRILRHRAACAEKKQNGPHPHHQRTGEKR